MSIRKALADGRIIIDPLRTARSNRRRSTSTSTATSGSSATTRRPTSTRRRPQENLTELVEVPDGGRVHPPSRRVRARLDLRARRAPRRPRRPTRRQSELGRLGLLIHSTAGFVDSGLGRAPHPRAVERREPADRDLPEHEDRPDLLPRDDDPGRGALREHIGRARSIRASAAPHRAATTSISAQSETS